MCDSDGAVNAGAEDICLQAFQWMAGRRLQNGQCDNNFGPTRRAPEGSADMLVVGLRLEIFNGVQRTTRKQDLFSHAERQRGRRIF